MLFGIITQSVIASASLPYLLQKTPLQAFMSQGLRGCRIYKKGELERCLTDLIVSPLKASRIRHHFTLEAASTQNVDVLNYFCVCVCVLRVCAACLDKPFHATGAFLV